MDFWSDLKQIFGAKDILSRDKMYSKHPLIEINSKLPKRRRLFRSHYVIMDLAINPGHGESGVFVICETTKRSYSKRTLFLLAVFISFILGLVMGLCISMSFVDKRLTNFKFASGDHLTNVSWRNASKAEVRMVADVTYVNGIFWDSVVETSLPRGFAEEDGSHWDDFVRKTAIQKIEEGCGRMQNRLVTFQDGTKACCRYRQNTDQIQGEMFSYYLGRLLKIPNVVPSTVVAINSSHTTWRGVESQLAAAQWSQDHPVVFTKYIQDLQPANIPPAFRQLGDSLFTSRRSNTQMFTHNTSDQFKIEEWLKGVKDAVEMAQWSDLVIFDYLTGNLDRVVNNLYNLQWNPDMLASPAHNLGRTATDLLVFLDNESGMLHGYRLLDKYEPYHSLLLGSICVFRRPTVEAVSTLSLLSNPGLLLSQGLPSPDLIPPLPDANGATLRLRVARVLHHVLACATRDHVRLSQS